jgi:RHS repeat-associated protein
LVSSTPGGTYTYDSQNRRTKKVAATTTHYVYGLNGLLYGEYDNAGALIREYVYLNDAPLAQVDAGAPETATYLHTDHLGTPRFGTNTGGTQVWAWAGDAFGVGASSGSATVNIRMPGQYVDAESGLFYNWNRYYNPAIGRYISSDPIGIEGGLNTFLYANASPVMYMDPEGLDYAQCMAGYIAVCTGIGGTIGATGGFVGGTIVFPGVGTISGTAGLGVAGAGLGATTGVALGNLMCPKDSKSFTTSNLGISTNSCNPPAGTICYFYDQVPPSKPHKSFSGSHYHLFKHNQLPNGACRWNPHDNVETLVSYPDAIACPFQRLGGR